MVKSDKIMAALFKAGNYFLFFSFIYNVFKNGDGKLSQWSKKRRIAYWINGLMDNSGEWLYTRCVSVRELNKL